MVSGEAGFCNYIFAILYVPFGQNHMRLNASNPCGAKSPDPGSVSIMLWPVCYRTLRSPFSQQIASDEPPPEACLAFVSIHGQHSCSAKDIKKLLKAAAGR